MCGSVSSMLFSSVALLLSFSVLSSSFDCSTFGLDAVRVGAVESYETFVEVCGTDEEAAAVGVVVVNVDKVSLDVLDAVLSTSLHEDGGSSLLALGLIVSATALSGTPFVTPSSTTTASAQLEALFEVSLIG